MRRHDLDVFSLAFGVLFVLSAVLFAAIGSAAESFDLARLWVVPVTGLGAVVVVLAIRAALNGRSDPS
jgi:hypothetical protein